jgi:hypothetical protein
MQKHIELDIVDGRFAYRRREDEIAAKTRLDGIHLIRTSLPKDKIGAQAAVAAYESLALVERAFRMLKSVDLKVRPVYHWLDKRVKAHVFLCMLAYQVEHHMRAALAPILFADTSWKPARALRSGGRPSRPWRPSTSSLGAKPATARQ